MVASSRIELIQQLLSMLVEPVDISRGADYSSSCVPFVQEILRQQIAQASRIVSALKNESSQLRVLYTMTQQHNMNSQRLSALLLNVSEGIENILLQYEERKNKIEDIQELLQYISSCVEASNAQNTQFIFVMLKRFQSLYFKKLNKLINTYILLFSNGIEKILQNIYF